MPIRNEGLFIERSLRAVIGQDYPAELLEIIVVDGMSTDVTREAVNSITRLYHNIKLLDNPAHTAAAAMNIGIREARGEIIVRIDGHTIVAKDYVTECIAALDRSSAENVGGRMNAVSSDQFGSAVAAATSCIFGIGNAKFHYSEKEEFVDTVYMGAWRRSLFQRIGWFDEELVRDQDDEFNYRLRSEGGRILLSPRIRSQYHNRATLESLFSQYFQYGYWKVRVMQKHPSQISLRQFIPSILVMGIVVPLVFSLFFDFAKLSVALVAGVYSLANLIASFAAALRKSWRLFPYLVLAFATLHFSYGLGFLTGLFKYWDRWRKENISQVIV